MKRLLALAGALAMIAASFAIRSWLEGGEGERAGGTASSAVEISVICDSALGTVCDGLAGIRGVTTQIEAGPATARALSGADYDPPAGPTAWLTLAPLPQMVREARQRAGLPSLPPSDGDPLARSALVTVGWSDRLQVLSSMCDASALSWRCIGDSAGEPWESLGGDPAWGRVEPGLADPRSDSVGMLTVSHAAVSFFGDANFASNDFDTSSGDATFRSWITNLVDSVPNFPTTRGTTLDQMLAAGPASYDLVGSTAAEAGAKVAGSRESGRLDVLTLEPLATADVVLVVIRDDAGGDALDDLRSGGALATILDEAGWTVQGPSGDFEGLPASNGLPKPGVVQAIVDL